MKIQFVQEPGYIHDLFYIFMLAYKTADAGSEEYAEIMQDTFGACPAELYTFFLSARGRRDVHDVSVRRGAGLRPVRGRCLPFWKTCRMRMRYSAVFFSSISRILKRRTAPSIRYPVIFMSRPTRHAQMVHLLSLCVDPAGHIRLLVKELQEKERLLKKYTEENFSVLLNLQAGLEPESLFRLLCPEEKMDDQNLEYSPFPVG